MESSGPIALVGSGEFEPWAEEVDRFLLSEAVGGDGTVAVVPTASAEEGAAFYDWGQKGLAHYERIGVPARLVEVRSRHDAHLPEAVQELARPSLIYFSGGNPAFLARTLAGSPFWDAVVAAISEGAALAGCSAGACILGEVAPESMTDRVEEEAWVPGFRLLPNLCVFPHWDALESYKAGLRDYFIHAVPEGMFALGIDERTAALDVGLEWRVFGGGRVSLYWDGSTRSFGPGDAFDLDDVTPLSPASVVRPAESSLRRVVGELPPDVAPIGLLSGDEFTPAVDPFDETLLGLTGRRVAVLLSGDPEDAARQGPLAIEHYARLGATAELVDVFGKEKATEDALPDYDLLYIGGGDPSRLLVCLRRTPLWEEAMRRWRMGYALGGSSAGAMALCRDCLVPEPGAGVPTRWTEGLGPLEGFGLAVHASTRPREWLEQVTARAPVPVVALDDATGLLLRPGDEPLVSGSGSAWLTREPRVETASGE